MFFKNSNLSKFKLIIFAVDTIHIDINTAAMAFAFSVIRMINKQIFVISQNTKISSNILPN